MRRTRTMSLTAAGAAAALLVAGCGTADETPTEDVAAETVTEEDAELETDEGPEPENTETEATGGGDGDTPEWAHPAVTSGDEIASFTVGDVRVDVYQVGVTEATSSGFFVDPEDNQPIIDEGDDIVFVNYVVTNEGEAVDLGSTLVNISARYDDWPYLQGMDSITDRDLYEEMGVHADATVPGVVTEPFVYTFETGQTYSTATNFHYQAGSPITFSAVITPVDDEGDLLHDDRLEGEGEGEIS